MHQSKFDQMTVKCQICGTECPIHEAVPVDLIRDPLVETLKESNPNLDPAGYVSIVELDRARFKHANDMAQRDSDDMNALRQEVADSLLNQDTISKNLDKQFDAQTTRGERIADKVASFGGSWTFIIIFMTILFTWMGINTALILAKPFDPFPYIFLNLILSCLAAIQAPVIMMSQNRGEAKDRLRSENDFKTNLKAEIEIQMVNQKLDKLINDQWKHLLEIQQMQMEMIQEMSKKGPGA
jgi:uncharacterized membrane protein